MAKRAGSISASPFAGLSKKVVGSVRDMEKKTLSPTETRDQIDAQVVHILAWTSLLEALEQKTPETIEIKNTTLAEMGRSIRNSALEVQRLVGSLAHANEKPR